MRRTFSWYAGDKKCTPNFGGETPWQVITGKIKNIWEDKIKIYPGNKM
jgi:hypothetical protein